MDSIRTRSLNRPEHIKNNSDALRCASNRSEFFSWIDIPLLKREAAASLRKRAQNPQELSIFETSSSLQREAAQLIHGAATSEYYTSLGVAFKDKQGYTLANRVWEKERTRRFDEERRYNGDEEIKERINMIMAKEVPAPETFSRSLAQIIVAIVDIAHTSSRIYCSHSTLAWRSKTSRNTVGKYLKMMEALGIIERVRSGGKNLKTGKCTTNKYNIKWNVLRTYLGIENKWETKYPSDTTHFNAERKHRNTFFSFEGCSRHINYAERIHIPGSACGFQGILSGILGSIRTPKLNKPTQNLKNSQKIEPKPASKPEKLTPEKIFNMAKHKYPSQKHKFDALTPTQIEYLIKVCDLVSQDYLNEGITDTNDIVEKCAFQILHRIDFKIKRR